MTSSLRQRYERHIDQERKRCVQVQKLSHDKKTTEMLNHREEVMEKTAFKRANLIREHIDQEQDIQNQIVQKEVNRERRKQEIERTEKLASELKKRNEEEYRDEQLRLKMRLESEALRDLESKIRIAYQQKELAAQMVEKRALKYDELARDAEINRIIAEEARRADEAIREQQLKQQKDKLSRIQDFKEVMAAKVKAERQLALNEYNADRIRIDEIIRKVNDEEEQDRKKAREKIAATRAWLNDNISKKARRLADEVERRKKEDEAITAHREAVDERKAKWEEKRRQRDEISSLIADEMHRQIVEKERERNKQMRMRQTLLEFQEEEKARRHEEMEREKKKKTTEEMRANFQEQMIMRDLQKKIQMAEEEEYRINTMAQFAIREKKERELEKARLKERQDYAQALSKQLADRQEQYLQKRAMEEGTDESLRLLEEDRLKLEEEERLRLLKEHAPKLKGYLPKGVFRDMNEVKLLGEDFEKEYHPLQQSSMSSEVFKDPVIEQYKIEKEKERRDRQQEFERKKKEAKEQYRQQELSHVRMT